MDILEAMEDFFPLGLIMQSFLPIRLYQSDVRMLPAARHELEKKVDELAQKIGIKKKLTIIEKYKDPFIANRLIDPVMTHLGVESMGNSFLPGKAGLIINHLIFDRVIRTHLIFDRVIRTRLIFDRVIRTRLIFDTSYKGKREFLLAHAICHIKNNSFVKRFLVLSITIVITSVVASILLSPNVLLIPPLPLIIVCSQLLVYSQFSKYSEQQADKMAYSICSVEAKLAASKIFETIQKENLERRGGLYTILINENGDSRLNFLDPSLKDRINYLKELQNKDPLVQQYLHCHA